jgi:hypothetical protein
LGTVTIPDTAVLQGLIARHFKRPEPSWLSRFTGNDSTIERYDPTIEEVRRVEDGGFFRRHSIFWVRVRGSFLEASWLPSLSSSGIFAFDGISLSYLNHTHPDDLQQVLAVEGRPLDQADPYHLASLFAEAILRRDDHDHVVLRSPDMLIQYEKRRYQLDQREFIRCVEAIKSPSVASDSRGGWLMSFVTLHGWMHEKETLARQEVWISANFSIRHQEAILSRKIFSRLPRVRY